jgi:hypothetical protein
MLRGPINSDVQTLSSSDPPDIDSKFYKHEFQETLNLPQSDVVDMRACADLIIPTFTLHVWTATMED